MRCKEFYERWEKDPNWCEKCATSVYYIDKYIELTERYPRLKDVAETALRPLFTLVNDENMPLICTNIAYELDMEKKVTEREVQEIIQKIKGEPKPQPKPKVAKDLYDRLAPYYPLDVIDELADRLGKDVSFEKWQQALKSFVASMWQVINERPELMPRLLNVWQVSAYG